MTRLSDTKPKACPGGIVMRRTESHVIEASIPDVSFSGDQLAEVNLRNTTLQTYPDNDPRWGKEPECE